LLCNQVPYHYSISPVTAFIVKRYENGRPAVSVGFMPLEQPTAIKDSEGSTTGWGFTSQKLLELSAVSLPANPEALARCVQKGFAENDLKRVFSAPALSQEDVYKELISIHQEIASIAIDFADRTVRAALAALKAAGVQPEAGAISFEELLSAAKAVKRGGVHAQTSPEIGGSITSVEQLEAMLAKDGGDDDDDITGIAEFERALGIDAEASGDGLERSPAGSRKWRDPGRRAREG
jgi:hypothetical protein